jgi:hypothetical protein
VGQRLFDRHGQTISPTVFGAIVIDTARKMLDSQEAMTRAIGQTASLEGGELSVGVGPYTADTWMGQVSGRLLQRYPRLHIAIHVEPWESLPDLLRRGRVDLFVASIEQIQGRAEVYLLEYLDPTRDTSGATGRAILDDLVPGLRINCRELDLTRERLLQPLNQMRREKAVREGWTYDGGIFEAFGNDGYTASDTWFVRAKESEQLQAPPVVAGRLPPRRTRARHAPPEPARASGHCRPFVRVPCGQKVAKAGRPQTTGLLWRHGPRTNPLPI